MQFSVHLTLSKSLFNENKYIRVEYYICSEYIPEETSRFVKVTTPLEFLREHQDQRKEIDKIENYNLFSIGVSHLSFTCCYHFHEKYAS